MMTMNKVSLTATLAATMALAVAAPAFAKGPAPDPAVKDFQRVVDAAYAKYKDLKDGKNADYIPILTETPSDLFGVVIVTKDGQVYSAGDVDYVFSIQSVSKPFTAALVMQDHGSAEVIASAYTIFVMDGATGNPKWHMPSGHDRSQPNEDIVGRTWPGSMRASGDSAPTTSTSIRSTGSIPPRRIEETMEALHDLVRPGKVRYLGASSMWAWQFAKMQHAAERHGWTKFVSMQNHYNLVYREEEREMIPLARDQGVGQIPWSPLARGFLAGNRGRDDRTSGVTARARTDEIALKLYYQASDFEVLAALQALALEKGVPSAVLAYAWLLSRPGVSAPIVGASQTWQLEEAVKALDLTLTKDDVASLEAPYRPHPILGQS